jgi:hypothetical protein
MDADEDMVFISKPYQMPELAQQLEAMKTK